MHQMQDLFRFELKIYTQRRANPIFTSRKEKKFDRKRKESYLQLHYLRYIEAESSAVQIISRGELSIIQRWKVKIERQGLTDRRGDDIAVVNHRRRRIAVAVAIFWHNRRHPRLSFGCRRGCQRGWIHGWAGSAEGLDGAAHAAGSRSLWIDRVLMKAIQPMVQNGVVCVVVVVVVVAEA